MNYVVDLVVRSEADVDVFLYRKYKTALIGQQTYCVVGIHAIVAYLYISALANMLSAQLDAKALASYRYVKSVYDLDQRQN